METCSCCSEKKAVILNHIIRGYFGFGDNIWHIPFVHHLAKRGEVFMYTPFPELFQFKNVYCLPPPDCKLKLQAANIKANPLFADPRRKRPNGNYIRFNYAAGFKRGLNVIQSFESVVPLQGSFFFDYQPKKFVKVDELAARAAASGKRLCLLRLPSVRDEWANPNRNGKMEYFQACINHLKDRYYFVSVGDIGNRESYDGEEPSGIDERCDKAGAVNHLNIWEVMDLLNRSALAISIQCNILPMAQLLKRKAFIINGGYVSHHLLTDPRLFEIGYAQPDPFCFCIKHGRAGEHRCSKEIPQEVLLSRLQDYIEREAAQPA